MTNLTKGKFLLAVDGGNSKTDYLLCRVDGSFVDLMRRGSISHEVLGGYDEAKAALKAHLDELLMRNSVTVDDIAIAVFGLAGADLNDQIKRLTDKVKELGFTDFRLINDGVLGVKAMSDCGICAVNGTGTVVIGIDYKGKVLQIGGTGGGDIGGGGHIMRQAVNAVYGYFYRMGAYTTLVPPMMELLQAKEEGLLEQCSDFPLVLKNMQNIIGLVDKHAINGDKVASDILTEVGSAIGCSVAGCANHLYFVGEVNIVMTGSIWHKLNYPGLISSFKSAVQRHVDQDCKFMPLNAPPVCGGMIWAKRLYDKRDSLYRQELLSFLTMQEYERIVKGG